MVSITVTTNTIVTLKVSIIIIYDNKHDDLYNNRNLKKENADMSSIKKRRIDNWRNQILAISGKNL